MKNEELKYRGRMKIRLLALATLATLAACTPDVIDDTDPAAGGNPTALEKMDPETVVGMRTTLTAFGGEDGTRNDAGTRNGDSDTRNVNLADIPAWSEVTADTKIGGSTLNRSLPTTRSAATPLKSIEGVPEGRGSSTRSATPDTRSGLTKARSRLDLPGAASDGIRYDGLYPVGADLTVGGLEKATFNSAYYIDPFTLRLRHFNLNATNAAGTPQPHSRLGIMRIDGDDYHSPDQLLAVASLNGGTDGSGANAPGFNFRLRHATAKLSVLVKKQGGQTGSDGGASGTGDGSLLDMTDGDGVLKDAYVVTKRTDATPVYTGGNCISSNGKKLHPDLLSYLMNTGSGTPSAYPDDPKDLAAETGIAIRNYNYGTDDDYYTAYALQHPDAADAPANLLNGIVCASATHGDEEEVEEGVYASPLLNDDGTPKEYGTRSENVEIGLAYGNLDGIRGSQQPADALVLRLKDITAGGGSGTAEGGTRNAADGEVAGTKANSPAPDGYSRYILPLRSIVLTELKDNDPRRDANTGRTGDAGNRTENNTGHLLFLRPGEHLTLTVTVDRNRIVSATGTIGTWSQAEGEGDFTEDDGKLPAIKRMEDVGDGIRSYEVSDPAALRALAEWVNGGSIDPVTGKDVGIPYGESGSTSTDPTDTKENRLATHITLTADIDLGSLPDISSSDDSNWTPIGTGRIPYTGIFDGKGHTVYGLKIDRPGTDNLGFFGRIGKNASTFATVRNLTVTGSVTGGNYTGGIAGENNYSLMENCHNRVVVTGSRNIGGVVGTNTGGTLIACYNTAEISGSSYTGGVVGGTDGTLIACYNTAKVSDGNDNGGVVGYNYPGGTLIACYTTHTGSWVTAVRFHGTLTACYPNGPNTIFGTDGGSGTGGNDGISSIQDLNANYLTTLNLAILAYNNTATTAADKQCPYHYKAGKGGTGTDASTPQPPTLEDGAPGEAELGFTIDNSGGAPLYRISAAKGLQYFATLVNQGGDNSNLNAELTADINLKGLPETEYTDGNTPGTANWAPIGTDYDTPYTGTFDGKEHTVSGLKIDRPGADYQGFFGCIGKDGSTATVRNLTAEGSVKGQNGVGGIVGANFYSLVENCISRVKVEGGGNGAPVGGVAGYNGGGTLTACYATATVSGNGNNASIGGVTGNNDSGTLTACYATAKVSGSGSGVNIGGVTGNNDSGTLTACYATAKVSGSGEHAYIGGVAGYNGGGTLTACYATATVSGGGNSACVGGVAGSNDYGTLTACYATAKVSGDGTNARIGSLVGWNGFSSPLTSCFYQWNTSPASGAATQAGIGYCYDAISKPVIASNSSGSIVIDKDGNSISGSAIGNITLTPVGYTGTAGYPASWDLVVGTYPGTGGTGTLNAAITDWNNDSHGPGTARHCPYHFEVNPAAAVPPGDPDGTIPGGMGTTPLILKKNN